jgi:hypothetical protein
MENGSGGFMGDLVFVGGNFGAYLGNQQFTTSGLLFDRCRTGLQIHWYVRIRAVFFTPFARPKS